MSDKKDDRARMAKFLETFTFELGHEQNERPLPPEALKWCFKGHEPFRADRFCEPCEREWDDGY